MIRWIAAALVLLLLAGCGDNSPTEEELGKIADASDDAEIYSSNFRQAANEILRKNGCTSEAMENNAGFWRVPEIKEAPVYFIYCSEPMHSSNRYYLNADTGKISQIKEAVY